MNIRRAAPEDLIRVAEIEIFNYRLNFYPIFRSDEYYFGELQVPARAAGYEADGMTEYTWVYDDGVVKGFCVAQDGLLRKLFVEPVLQGQGIGGELLDYAVTELGVTQLWALEKNLRAIRFYKRFGFRLTEEKKLEEGTAEYLVKMKR